MYGPAIEVEVLAEVEITRPELLVGVDPGTDSIHLIAKVPSEAPLTHRLAQDPTSTVKASIPQFRWFGGQFMTYCIEPSSSTRATEATTVGAFLNQGVGSKISVVTTSAIVRVVDVVLDILII